MNEAMMGGTIWVLGLGVLGLGLLALDQRRKLLRMRAAWRSMVERMGTGQEALRDELRAARAELARKAEEAVEMNSEAIDHPEVIARNGFRLRWTQEEIIPVVAKAYCRRCRARGLPCVTGRYDNHRRDAEDLVAYIWAEERAAESG